MYPREYPTKSGRAKARPVVPAADPKNRLLSFVHLLELHVLAAIRRQHGVKMGDIRHAVGYLERRFGHEHPLVQADMATDGQDLFVSHLGELVNITKEGQLAMRELLTAHLRRIERDERGLAIRLYPFTRRGTRKDAARRSATWSLHRSRHSLRGRGPHRGAGSQAAKS